MLGKGRADVSMGLCACAKRRKTQTATTTPHRKAYFLVSLKEMLHYLFLRGGWGGSPSIYHEAEEFLSPTLEQHVDGLMNRKQL